MNVSSIIQRCPGRQRSVFCGRTDSKRIHVNRITAPDLVFVTIYDNRKATHYKFHEAFVFVDENDKWYYLDAPNSNVLTMGRICFGNLHQYISSTFLENTNPNIPELYWSSVFTLNQFRTFKTYTFKKMYEVPAGIRQILTNPNDLSVTHVVERMNIIRP